LTPQVVYHDAATELVEPSSPVQQCKSCGNEFSGLYCNLCGEKVLEVRDRSFRSFLSNIWIAITFTDNKFVKTLWMLIKSPGLLSKEYVEGRRVNYIRPLQLFFVLNLVYFLFPVLQLFNTSLRTQMYLRTHSPIVREMVFSKIGYDKLALEGYTLLYNEKSTSLAKLLVIVFVIVASIPMMIIYRKRNRYFTDHIALSVELTAFNLAVNALLLSLLLMGLSAILHLTTLGWERYLNDTTLTITFICTNMYFLYRAGKLFYNQSGWKLILKVILGIVGLFIALEIYRLILFLLTFWTI
jgi:hypothetical protein